MGPPRARRSGPGTWRVEINATGVKKGTTDTVVARANVDRCGPTSEFLLDD
ncbi:MAG: hypothetical protein OEM67_13830 [Thermoleophilia bacterium]|nr:hypothetical protein [Thermoleophilia bacterium]MDH3724674.1 hypothetical protein [Thermoleophilia bacterium]